MNENKSEIVENKPVQEAELPLYLITEHRLGAGAVVNIFDLNLEDVIFEKMYLMFDKLEPLNKQLLDAKLELKINTDKILLETDWNEALGTKRPTIAEKEAHMRPLLSKYEDAVDDLNQQIRFYKDKLVIINDLIKAKGLSLKIEGALLE